MSTNEIIFNFWNSIYIPYTYQLLGPRRCIKQYIKKEIRISDFQILSKITTQLKFELSLRAGCLHCLATNSLNWQFWASLCWDVFLIGIWLLQRCSSNFCGDQALFLNFFVWDPLKKLFLLSSLWIKLTFWISNWISTRAVTTTLIVERDPKRELNWQNGVGFGKFALGKWQFVGVCVGHSSSYSSLRRQDRLLRLEIGLPFGES